jgi:hypothetical protein
MGFRSNREPNIRPAAVVPEIFKKSLLVTSIIPPPFLKMLMIQTISFTINQWAKSLTHPSFRVFWREKSFFPKTEFGSS